MELSSKAELVTAALNRVVVHVPVSAFNDAKSMSKITASLLENIGHTGCHSGHIFDFRAIREFVVNPATLELKGLVEQIRDVSIGR